MPEDLVLLLRDACAARTFVEGGTYQGDTAAWAASHFSTVVSIELAKELYERARPRLSRLSNVDLRFGDTRVVLSELVPTLKAPCIFWLDSHWSGGETYGESDECPLLDELRIIESSSIEHILLIDDARLFLAPPPAPHRIDAWPTIDAVIGAMNAASRKSYLVVHEDVIVRVPHSAREVVSQHFQRRVTEEWNAYLKPKRGFRLFRRGS